MIRKNGKSNGPVPSHALAGGKAIAELVDTPALATTCPPPAADECAPLPLQHFRLQSHPFADNVNPEFFFRTEGHEEAFLRMKECVEQDMAVGLTTAVSGTGKTLLTQILLQELDPRRFKTILVLVYPGMARAALLREILAELEIGPEHNERMSVYAMISSVHNEIIRLHRRGIKLVVILDEVHFLRSDSLHILRTLSNIEIPERKLVTLLLFGEESLLHRMEHPIYRSLLGRIFERVSLRPLSREEMEQYIKFRCLMVGGGPSLFAADVFERVYELSGGIPREINRICHGALTRAARKGLIRVDASVIE